MSEYGSDVELTLPIHIDHDFDIDEDGVSSIVSLIYIGDNEDPLETRVDLEGVADELCEDYGDINGYQHLYSIAHEFTRLSERLRESAMRIEDTPAYIDDLFNLSDE